MSNAVVRVAGGKCQRDARATCAITGGTSSNRRHRLLPTRVVMKHLFITAMILFYRLRNDCRELPRHDVEWHRPAASARSSTIMRPSTSLAL